MSTPREHPSHVALIRCVECRREDDGARGWRAYLLADEPERVAIYCPNCAEREFGDYA
jgi:predicted RNA-binding Zn-ribbon protein involved in translation (DUF1610 family)